MSSNLLRTFRYGMQARCRYRLWARRARTWSSLLLLVVLMAQLSGPRFGTAAKSSALWSEDVPALDSFSEPAVATAILQQRVRNLYFTYCLGDEETNAVLRTLGNAPRFRAAGPTAPQNSAAAPMSSRDGQKGDRASSRASLLELHALARGLQGDLLETLLAVHFENQAWNEFLDCYLELLAVAPGRVELSSWANAALLSARNCGRTDELLEALRHFTRFGKDPRMVARFQRVLENGDTGEIQGVAGAGWSALDPVSLCVAANSSAPPSAKR